MPSALKLALEDLLRHRKLQTDEPPLRGEDARDRGLPTGIDALDELLPGGLPRGQLSEFYGPASAGRTAAVLSLAARTTSRGALVGCVDPLDHLDPASATSCGVDLARLLWLRGDPDARGRSLLRAISATGTLVGAGVFDLVVLDVAGFAPAELRRLPGATWLRLQRALEDTSTAAVVVASAHVAHGPQGVSLGLQPRGAVWSGRPGPGRLLTGLAAEAQRTGLARRARLELRATA